MTHTILTHGRLATLSTSEATAEIEFCQARDGKQSMGTLDSVPDLIPEDGSFAGASFQISLDVSRAVPSVPPRATARSTRKVCRAEWQERDDSTHWFELTDLDTGTDLKRLSLTTEQLPDWLPDDESCYVALELTYDHELTVEQSDRPESEVEQHRRETDRPTTGVDQLWSYPSDESADERAITGVSYVDETDTIYAGTWNGDLVAVDATTGECRWEAPALCGHAATVTAKPGFVYVGGTDACIYALDADDGEEVWSGKTVGAIRDPPCVAAVPLQETSSGDDRTPVVYAGTASDHVYAFDGETGERIWQSTRGWMIGTPTVVGETGYVPGWNKEVYKLDAMTGEVTQLYSADVDSQTPIRVTDDRIYVPWKNHTITAFDRDSDRIEWRAENSASSTAVNLEPSDGTVYACGLAPIYALDSETGERVETLEASGEWIAVSDGQLVASSRRETVAFDAETGESAWRYDTGGPVAIADDIVYVGTNEGIYALRHSE